MFDASVVNVNMPSAENPRLSAANTLKREVKRARKGAMRAKGLVAQGAGATAHQIAALSVTTDGSNWSKAVTLTVRLHRSTFALPPSTASSRPKHPSQRSQDRPVRGKGRSIGGGLVSQGLRGPPEQARGGA